MKVTELLQELVTDSGKEALLLVNQGAYQLQRRLEMAGNKRVCLGITGLSRSGKSTFITSLINQLLHFDKSRLSGFEPFLDKRILSVKQVPLGKGSLKAFPYDEFYQAITSDEPAWPTPTEAISGCALEIRMRHHNSSLIPFSSDEFTLKLEIRDYPGEWLLDLPMLEMSYREWCIQCLAQYTEEPRSSFLGDLFVDLQSLDPFATADEMHLKTLNERFKAFLKTCKSHGKSLGFIQPGRFLIPGEVHDEQALCFVPMLGLRECDVAALEKTDADSYYKRNEARYNSYIQTYVKPFFKDYFSGVDRQLVLVDVIQALYSGPAYVDDLREVMNRIGKCFSYGKGNILERLFAPKIDRLMYVATKIDQVTAEDHDAVRHLLAAIVRKSQQDIQHLGVSTTVEATTAVRSSETLAGSDGNTIHGVDVDGKARRYINPAIPDRIPESNAEWEDLLAFPSPVLRPPSGLSYKNQDVIPHIRLDSVLQHLIGDKCQ